VRFPVTEGFTTVTFVDNHLISINDRDHKMALWDLSGKQSHLTARVKEYPTFWIASSPKSGLVACIQEHPFDPNDLGRKLVVFKINAHEPLCSFSVTRELDIAALAPSGEIIVVPMLNSDKNVVVQVRHSRNGKLIKKWERKGKVERMQISPNSKLLALGGRDEAVEIIDLSTGASVRRLKGHGGGVWSLAFSSDGRLLASGADDQELRIWEVESGRCLHTFSQKQRAMDLAFSPNGALLASAGGRGELSICDLKTRKCQSLQINKVGLASVLFLPDGTRLICSGAGIQLLEQAQ
jgi:WD40 repeat protein